MKMKKMRFTLLALFVGLVTLTSGQDINEAGAKYNEGAELDKAKNYSGAIQAWEESIKICEAVGAEADELKATVQKVLAYTYFKEGITLYKQKEYDQAIAALINSEKIATLIDDARTQKQASTYIPKIFATKGLELLQDKKHDAALEVFNNALEHNPKCVDAFYGIGMTYKDMNQIDKATEAFDNVLLYGEGIDAAEKKVESSKEAALVLLETNAATELQNNNSAETLKLLTKALEYSQNSYNTYYLLALANNKLKNWDATIEAAKKAMALSTENASALNFQLGIAYEGKNDAANACASYKKVTSGPNVELAKFQITQVLKCN